MLALVRLAADMLLPEGMMRKLCDVLLGLTMMLCMLRALRSLLLGWSG